MSIKLYGYPVSNFYNKVKIALLEKELEFSEERSAPSRNDPEFLKLSPMGKIPFLEHQGHIIFESTPILEYLDEAFPNSRPLFPSDPIEAARCREIMAVIDQHLDSAVRPIYNIIIGKSFPDSVCKKAIQDAEFAIRALGQIAILDPFIAGPVFSAADCAAAATLGVANDSYKLAAGKDLLETVLGLPEYMERIAANPAVKKTQRAYKATLRARSMSQG